MEKVWERFCDGFEAAWPYVKKVLLVIGKIWLGVIVFGGLLMLTMCYLCIRLMIGFFAMCRRLDIALGAIRRSAVFLAWDTAITWFMCSGKR